MNSLSFKGISGNFSDVPGVFYEIAGAFYWVSGSCRGVPGDFNKFQGRFSGFEEVSGDFKAFPGGIRVIPEDFKLVPKSFKGVLGGLTEFQLPSLGERFRQFQGRPMGYSSDPAFRNTLGVLGLERLKRLKGRIRGLQWDWRRPRILKLVLGCSKKY